MNDIRTFWGQSHWDEMEEDFEEAVVRCVEESEIQFDNDSIEVVLLEYRQATVSADFVRKMTGWLIETWDCSWSEEYGNPDDLPGSESDSGVAEDELHEVLMHWAERSQPWLCVPTGHSVHVRITKEGWEPIRILDNKERI